MKELFLQYGYLNALWLLYLCIIISIGWACWQWIFVNWIDKRRKFTFAQVDSVWFRLLLFAATGFTAVGVLSLPFYTFRWSSLVYTAVVFILFFVSLYCLGMRIYNHRALLRRWLLVFFGKGFQYQFNSKAFLTGACIVLLAALIVGDGIFSAVRLNHIADGSDANVHLSRIVDITENGFSIRDGFFAGADETRYAFNFVYALFVPIGVAAKFFGALPFETAVESPLFFRSIQLLAIGALSYGLVRLLFNASKRQAFFMSVLAAYVGLFVNHFSYSYYPNILVLAWFALLILALLTQAIQSTTRNLSTVLVLMTSVCIAGTHPTYGIIAAFLVALIRITLFVIAITKKRNPFTFNLWIAIAACSILVLPGVFVFLQPNHMTDQAIMTESGQASISMLGTKVFPPEFGMTTNVLWNVLQIIGTFTIIFLAFRRSIKVGVICAVTLGITLLTISDPIFVRLMNILHVPYWVMSRFASINVILGYGITVCFGVLAAYKILKLISARSSKEAWVKGLTIVAGIVLTSAFLTTLLGKGYATYKESYDYAKYNTVAMSTFERISHDVSPYLAERDLVLATNYTSYYLPVVKPATVIYTDSLHMPPSVDGGDRKQCQIDLFSSLDKPEALRSMGVKYIVIDAYAPNGQYGRMLKMLESLPDDYKKVANDNVYTAFAIANGVSASPPRSCSEFQRLNKSCHAAKA